MYSVDHLVQQHLKQMEKLSRQQEKAARKREKQQQKLEEAFARFREELMPVIPVEAEAELAETAGNGPDSEAHWRITAPSQKRTGFMHVLRAFLF